MVDSHADVLIVGAGASGGVAALRLARAGVRVVCLEQGHWPDRADFRGAEPDWELSAQTRWSGSPNQRGAPEDYPIDDSSSDISILNYNGVGGGTVLYNAQWPRMAPADFAVRSVDGIADDWPLSLRGPAPLLRADRPRDRCLGSRRQPDVPAGRRPSPCRHCRSGEAGLLLARAHDRLGWHWWPDTDAHPLRPLSRAPPLRAASRPAAGLRRGRQVVDRSEPPAGERWTTGAPGHRRRTGPPAGCGPATASSPGAEWTDGDGTRRFPSADVVLLACNGIGTPRLLLNFLLRTVPRGAGQRLGAGRQEADAAPPRDGDRLLRPRAPELAGAGRGRHPVGWSSTESDGTRVRAWGTVGSLVPTGGPLRNALGGRGPSAWGRGHHREYPPPASDAVRPGCLICRGPPGGDQPGRALPGPRRLLWRSRPHGRLPGEREFEAPAGMACGTGGRIPPRGRSATPPRSPWWDRNGHLMGTARMGEDPDASVVDPLGDGARRPQSRDHRRERVRDRGRGQSDEHHRLPRPAGCRSPTRAPLQPAHPRADPDVRRRRGDDPSGPAPGRGVRIGGVHPPDRFRA